MELNTSGGVFLALPRHQTWPALRWHDRRIPPGVKPEGTHLYGQIQGCLHLFKALTAFAALLPDHGVSIGTQSGLSAAAPVNAASFTRQPGFGFDLDEHPF